MQPIDNQPADKHLTHKVRQLCAEGYRLYDTGDYRAALRIFYQAWLLVPKPQVQWTEAGWILTAMGDSYFRLGQYEQGREALQSALCCPDTTDSPFAYLRLGQCLWELGRAGEARAALYHAWQLAQTDIFAAEDARYQQAIADLLPHGPSGSSNGQHQ